MSNETPPPPGPPDEHQPNWGNAYPPPPPPYQPPPPGYAQFAPLQPKHPQATTAMILGILGLVVCGVVAPFAWVIGSKTVNEIDANPAVYGGRSEANAGKIMGIIGSCLLILSVIALVVLIVVAVSAPEAFDDNTTNYSIGQLFS